MKYYIKNTGDKDISVRTRYAEGILLHPGEDCEMETFPGDENVVLTQGSQPYDVTVIGGYC